ncbi:ABC transporter permease [Metasolibacillus meyeri]|uniref:ABC transporter permease n=1 Tax=Metasolibacillus meyeri TaxID=1071052 RepID=UPI000D306C1F|nr:ABC transporter permease [Metasolibacillus meyeri]
MKRAMYMRALHLKYEWKSTVFWLVFPFIGTVFLYQLALTFIGESKVPIAVAVEDDSAYAMEIVEQLQTVEYLNVRLLQKTEAIRLLEQHELDSVFVIRKKYEENIKEGRKKLIEAYASNRSYAYETSKELMSSVVMEQALRAKTARDIEALLINYDMQHLFDEQIIEEKVRKRQIETDLIQIPFSLFNAKEETGDKIPYVSKWAIWSSLTVLATFFLFDWFVKERNHSIRQRWVLGAQTYMSYAFVQFVLYYVVLLLVDLFAFFLLSQSMSLWSIAVLCLCRFVLNSYAFMVVALCKNPSTYYILSILVTLLFTLTNGGIVPIRDSGYVHQLFAQLHPMYALLKVELPIAALLLCSMLMLVGGRLKNA